MSGTDEGPPFFSRLKWNADSCCHEAVHVFEGGEEVGFLVRAESDRDTRPLEIARELFLWVCVNVDDLFRRMTDKYYPVYTEYWSDGPPVSREDFMSEIVLDSIVVFAEDEMEVAWSLAPFFGDHVLSVRMRGVGVIRDIGMDG